MVVEQGRTALFVPHVKKFIDALLVNVQRVGLTTGSIEVHQPKSGGLNDRSSSQREMLFDRFELSIPYACSSLKWEFIFQSNSKAFPPDFIFEDSTFDPDIRKLRSLRLWDEQNANSFSDLVRELIEEYKKEQMSLLVGHGQIQIEIAALLQNTEITNEDIEVHVDSKGRSNAVNVLIQLPIDFSCIPEAYTVDIDEKCVVVLFVRYTENSRVMSHILASPELEGEQYFSLLGINNLQIPIIVNGYTLSEYVLTVTEFIKEKISAVANSYQKRLDFVSAFVTLYKKNVLEYDGEMFSSIALLVDSKDFYFNVLISLSPCFPEDPPVIKCSSNYHITSGCYGKPFCKEYKNCPYSPRWQPIEMAERYWKFISEKADVFKIASLNF